MTRRLNEGLQEQQRLLISSRKQHSAQNRFICALPEKTFGFKVAPGNHPKQQNYLTGSKPNGNSRASSPWLAAHAGNGSWPGEGLGNQNVLIFMVVQQRRNRFLSHT